MRGRFAPYWPTLADTLSAGVDLTTTGVRLTSLAEVVTERRLRDRAGRTRLAMLYLYPDLVPPPPGIQWPAPDAVDQWRAEALLDDRLAERLERALPADLVASELANVEEALSMQADEGTDGVGGGS